MLCLSHQATINMLDGIAEGHDEKVHEWKDSLLTRLPTEDYCDQVMYQRILCEHQPFMLLNIYILQYNYQPLEMTSTDTEDTFMDMCMEVIVN